MVFERVGREFLVALRVDVDVDLDDVVHLSIHMPHRQIREPIIELLIFANVASGWLRADRKSHYS